jgi:hypothetical protein
MPTRATLRPLIDRKLNKARRPKKPVPMPIPNEARLFQDLGIGPQNHAALALSFSNITDDFPEGIVVSSADASACTTRKDCVDLVFKRANGDAS